VVDYQSFTDYYPFGMQMKERSFSSSSYRFGFNGKEKDDEVSGSGNCIAFEARIWDSRVVRFFSRDPREREYPWQSTYVYFKNSPIRTLDVLGMGDDPTNDRRAQRKMAKFDRKLEKMSRRNNNAKFSQQNFDDVHAKYKNKRWYWNKEQFAKNNSGVRASANSRKIAYSISEIYAEKNWIAIAAARGIQPVTVATPVSLIRDNVVFPAGANVNQTITIPPDGSNGMQITAQAVSATPTANPDLVSLTSGTPPVVIGGPSNVQNVGDGIVTGNVPIDASRQFVINYTVDPANATVGPSGVVNWAAVALQVRIQTFSIIQSFQAPLPAQYGYGGISGNFRTFVKSQ
jgi:RHS repeat-associated protein